MIKTFCLHLYTILFVLFVGTSNVVGKNEAKVKEDQWAFYAESDEFSSDDESEVRHHAKSDPFPSVTIKVTAKQGDRSTVYKIKIGDVLQHEILLIRPISCVVHRTTSGANMNVIGDFDIQTLPYQIMYHKQSMTVLTPTPVFSGLISTISPSFSHPSYTIAVLGCDSAQKQTSDSYNQSVVVKNNKIEPSDVVVSDQEFAEDLFAN